jgi:U3 small nucleolar RNA-associated protein 22
MAPPATKRRKLSHVSDESADDSDSFASFSSDEPPNRKLQSNEQDIQLADEDIESEDNGSELEEEKEEEMDVDGESSEEEEVVEKPAVTKAKATPRKAGDSNDTIYNGDVFKSNLFKLQVDELLDQVRPGHTRKNDSIENAVRTLKTIIEDIPARKPSSVRSMAIGSSKTTKDLHVID